jgi:hypothetical protein
MSHRSRGYVLAAIMGIASILAAGVASANTVVPNSLAAVEGNSNNGFPFNLGPFGEASQRYQQVYDASQFSGLQLITDIHFRPDASTGAAFSSTLGSIQINLSTTSAVPDGLSATFAANVGGDDTIVFGPGPLTLSSAFTGAGPKDFDIAIILTTPFLYDPSAGNLLMDVRNFEDGSTTQFDAEVTTGDSISRVFTSGTGVGAATGTVDTSGLVTLFTTEAVSVPEPGTLLLTAVGVIALATAGRRRRR